LVAPDRSAIAHKLALHHAHWRRCGRRLLEARMQRLDRASRGLVHPAARLAQQRRDAQALAARLARATRHQFALRAHALTVLSERMRRCLAAPLPQWHRVQAARERWARAAEVDRDRRRARLATLAQNLAHLNPQGVLERGYSIVTADDGRIVQDAAQVSARAKVGITFARGAARARIDDVER
jgi:exodeoxyribonuclease VII large subunit